MRFGRGTVTSLADSPGNRSLYEMLLGDAFGALHPAVQRAHHVPLAAEGTLDVYHGSYWLTPFVVRLLHLPAAGQGQHASLAVAASGSATTWCRQIGESALRTRQRGVPPFVLERHGIGQIAFALEVRDGALVYRQAAIGVQGFMVSSPLLPRVSARVSAAGNGWYIEVEVTWRTHLVCRYHGWMRER
jgi:Domain of unknown function (DUF4166)